MPDLGPVDAVICDPPFEAEAHTLGRRIMSGEGLVEAPLPFGPMDAITRASVTFYTRKILNDGWFLAFCQIEAVPLWVKSIVDSGGKYKRSCIWVKPDATPQFSGDRPAQGFETFVCGWYGDGGSKWNGGGGAGYSPITRRGRLITAIPRKSRTASWRNWSNCSRTRGTLSLTRSWGAGPRSARQRTWAGAQSESKSMRSIAKWPRSGWPRRS